jgi:hypothetical protein
MGVENEIAKNLAEYLCALPATVTVDGAKIRLTSSRGVFQIECVSEDWFLIGPQMTKGHFQTHVTNGPRAAVNRKQLFARVLAWSHPAG